MNSCRHIFHLTKFINVKYLRNSHMRILNSSILYNDVYIYRNQCTIKNVSKNSEPSILLKLLSKVPFLDINKMKLQASGHLLYENIVDNINYVEFFQTLQLPDTFYTWFVVTELHIWMLLARLMAEGEDGRFTRNCVIQALWDDCNIRIKKLGAGSASRIQDQVAELSEQFQAALVSYDEGLQSSDVILANALWRRVFQYQCDNPEQIEMLVKYVRKQIKLLDELTSEELLYEVHVKWIPLLR